ELQKKHGKENVIALGHRNIPSDFNGILEKGDIQDKQFMNEIIEKHKITQIYHLASLMSAAGEKNPSLAWNVNMNGLKNILDISSEKKIKLFWPSSIAVFGPNTPKQNTPQHTILEPTTIYGITKIAGELLCQYYNIKYNLDVRSIRYPGLISYKAKPGDGTTEYSIWAFYGAIKDAKYTCFLKQDTVLPMMYMDDAINATIKIMESPAEKIKIRTSYNLSAISFSPKEIMEEIKKHIPEFEYTFEPDFRQQIAESWPQTIDDQDARKDWDWKHEFDLPKMTEIMIKGVREKFKNINKNQSNKHI
ncbi:NAD-dependent epimerase/dehydratase family protein, partial [Candidatus Woesearchaeota archaeon]|nr:NAD-dependent epimerase/dehydratase family protein [Candidatus Woesearchaeota archaeon]